MQFLVLTQQAQIEAEKQRQLEYEMRKKEELLNQKGMEQDIVNNLKARLKKLQEELDTVVRPFVIHNKFYINNLPTIWG